MAVIRLFVQVHYREPSKGIDDRREPCASDAQASGITSGANARLLKLLEDLANL